MDGKAFNSLLYEEEKKEGGPIIISADAAENDGNDSDGSWVNIDEFEDDLFEMDKRESIVEAIQNEK